jgi:hypothetical protein
MTPNVSTNPRGPFALLALLLALASPGATAAQTGVPRGLAVTPLLLDQLPGVMTIENGETVPARLRAWLADFEQDADGSNRFLPLGSTGSTCGGRARLDTVPAVVAPGGSVRVRVDVTPGPLCWGVVMVEASKDARPGNRVAVKFYHVPAGLTRDAAIVALTGDESRGRAVRMVVRSRGSAPVRPFGRMEFRDEAGRIVATSEVPDFGLHPGAERHVRVPVPDSLPAGRYVVLAVLDAGAADFFAAQAVLEL